ncbi:MAG: hypothetical protein Q4G03_11880 [Planctomycetia bacterium]|nr:hypothetical protein [Planctomycetia bacterium]
MTHNPNNADQTRPAGELLELLIAGVPVNFHWAPAGSSLWAVQRANMGVCKTRHSTKSC